MKRDLADICGRAPIGRKGDAVFVDLDSIAEKLLANTDRGADSAYFASSVTFNYKFQHRAE